MTIHKRDNTMLTPRLMCGSPTDACLLGGPLGSVVSISAALKGESEISWVMEGRLSYFLIHEALILLRNSFSIP